MVQRREHCEDSGEISLMFSLAEKFLFLVLVFSIPFQKRIFLFGPSPEGEGFFEWSSGFLYFTDLLILILFVGWAIRVLTGTVPVKMVSSLSWPLFLLLGFAFVSLTQTDLVDVGVYRFIKLAEFIFIFFYVASRVRLIGIKFVLAVFVASGVFQSILAILQFARQSSLGLEIFHESTLAVGIKGVAQINAGGMEFIRAYGTFPSPNVLAGFLGICLLFVFYLFIEEQRRANTGSNFFSTQGGDLSKPPIVNINDSPLKAKKLLPVLALTHIIMHARLWVFLNSIIPTTLWAYGVLIFLLSFGFLLTFSRGTIIFFVFTSVLFFAGIFLMKKLKQHRKQALKLAILVVVSWLLIIAIAWPEVSSRFLESSVSEPAIQERLFFNKVGADTISQNYSQLFLGVGIGNFVNHYMQFLPGFAPHLYQPVHNIFILIASEIGILGFIVFIVFLAALLWKSIKRFLLIRTIQDARDREHLVYVFSLVFVACFVLLIGMYDHYFWTLQQGGLMLWITLGLLAGSINRYN